MLKNRVTLYIFLLISFLIFTGCSFKQINNTQVKKECIIANVKAPLWACSDYKDDYKYFELASTPKSNFYKDLGKNKFIIDAKEKLIKKIKNDVKNSTAQYAKRTGKNNQEMVNSISTLVWNQHGKSIFSNVGKITYWENNANNMVYVFLYAKKSKILPKFDNDIKMMVDNKFKIENSEEALNKLIDY